MQEARKPKPQSGISKKITVWIHGTRGAEIFPVALSKQVKQVEETLCAAPQGLHQALTIDPKFHNQSIAHYLAQADSSQFPLKHIYSFGWSGDLDPAARKKAANDLHDQLMNLITRYIVRYAAMPHITLITHSHGGNVALNLATIPESPITINRLILLACPVQQETAQYADAPMFQSVYAIHSHADALQILDPQGLHPIKEGIKESWANGSLKPLGAAAKESSKIPLFSERHFASQKVKHVSVSWKEHAPWGDADLQPFGPLADMIKKWAQLDTKGRGLLHVEFLLATFMGKLSEIIDNADRGQVQAQKDFIDLEYSI